MKKFSAPEMEIKKLEVEEIIRTSGDCWESFDCKDCYGEIIVCPSGFECTKLDCPCLGALHI